MTNAQFSLVKQILTVSQMNHDFNSLEQLKLNQNNSKQI